MSKKEARLPAVMQNVFQLFQEGMVSRYHRALDRIPAQLRDEARCASDMSITEACVIAIENTEDKRADMLASFESAMKQEFKAYQDVIDNIGKPPKPMVASSLDLTHLSLVEEDSLQEHIDIQTMVANTFNACEYLLVPICSGITKAYGVGKIDTTIHPLSPGRVGQWMQQSLAVGKFIGVVRHTIYQVFREELFDTIAPLYKEVIDLFQNHSIEVAMQQAKTHSLNVDSLLAQPVDLGWGASSAKSVEAAKQRRKPDPQSPLSELVEEIDFRQEEELMVDDLGVDNLGVDELAVDELAVDEPGSEGVGIAEIAASVESMSQDEETNPAAKLLNMADWLKSGSIPSVLRFDGGFESEIDASYGLSDIRGDDDRTVISVSARQLDSVLSEIQLQLLRDETDWVSKLRQYLQGRTNEHELCVINPFHENMMKLMNHALNLICKEFHPSIARYINSLRVAFVRLAITDASFLSSSMHPGKSLFDGLTFLCYGLNPSDKRIIKQLFRTVRSYYDIGDGEYSSFEQLQHELIGFIDAQRHRTLQKEEQELQALYYQKQRYLAFKTADAFIETRLESLPHRLKFHDLLHFALRYVLAESYLNGGANSESWRLTTQLFNAILWTTQAHANEQDKHKILRTMPKLMDKLHRFFKKYDIALDMQSLIVMQMNEIQKMVVNGQDGSALTDDELSHTQTINYLLTKVNSETKEHYRQKQCVGNDHSINAPFPAFEKAPKIKPGQWLVYWVDNRFLMCKLVFHFSPLDKLVFFNWEGEKLFERESEKVTDDLKGGYARMLDLPIPLESAMRYVVKQCERTSLAHNK